MMMTMMMENETSSGFCSDSSDKATAARKTTTVDDCNGHGGHGGGDDLCLKLQRTESFPYKMIFNHHRSSQGVGVGPTFINGLNQGSSRFITTTTNDIYDAAAAAAAAVFPVGGATSVAASGSSGVGVGGGGSVSKKTLQPFHSTAFKSPGGGGRMAASLSFPFTSAQWQELERQALIYKYMVASVPIPPDLLLPISRNFSSADNNTSSATPHSTLGRASCFNLRFSNNTDPEPGRCRRTDGKKWRCSRDVAPDQKYCERHMHRGRPRSRKHVEAQAAAAAAEMKSHSSINNNNNLSSVLPTTTTTSSSSLHLAAAAAAAAGGGGGGGKSFSGFSPKSGFKVPPFETMATSASQYRDTRSMEWMMKGEPVPISATEQQWDQYMNSKSTGLRNASAFQQQYQETLSLNSYSGYNGCSEAQNQSDQCCLFLNPEFSSLDESLSSDHRETPRRFIDAWSNASSDSNKPSETNNKSSGYGNQKLSPSTLTLSMSGCNSTTTGEAEIDQIQMGLGVIDSQNNGNLKSQPLSWMTQVPWMNSPPPGGPLAEVLQSSTAAIHGCNSTNSKTSSCGGGGLNLMIEGWNCGGNGNGGDQTSSPRMTSMSSPSGVLQKTFASLSDSSGNSSPSSFTAAGRSEFALQLLNHSKLPS